ncbi:MAG: hypothetical protein GW823_00050 [Bacteroidetes bacterium]|nr:hypothetical protein [Bacteroidota bacterium]
MLQLLESSKRIPSDFKLILERKLQLAILEVGDSLSTSVAKLVPKIIGAVILIIGVFFGLIALALWLGELFGNTTYGFLAISATFLVIGILLVAINPEMKKNGIKQSIENNFIELSDKLGAESK